MTIISFYLSLFLIKYNPGSEASASQEYGEAEETVKVFALAPLFSKEGLGEI